MTRAQAKVPPLMTVADFLEWPGDGTGMRYELVDGELRAMAPPSDTHSLIHSNLSLAIGNYLRRKRPRCRINITPGVQPHVRANWNFRNPDLGVSCEPNEAGASMLPQPILLIEILSPGNAKDTWDNVARYATIPCVKEILIVHSTRMRVEILRRDTHGDWPENPEVTDAPGTVVLESTGQKLRLVDIYRDTHLSRK